LYFYFYFYFSKFLIKLFFKKEIDIYLFMVLFVSIYHP